MKSCFLIFICFLFQTLGFSQGLSASINKNHVAVNETVDVTFSFSGNGTGFQAPSFADFNVLSGPNNSQAVQIINGRMSQSTSYSYYLSPKKEGKFVIGPASITLGGKKVESNSITIEVTKTVASGKGKSYQGANDNLFVKTNVSKQKVYLGEQVTISYKVYARVNLVGFQNAKMPSYTGFWSEDLKSPSTYSVTKETLNGLQYSVVEFKTTCLFPQKSGSLPVEPIEIDAIVRQQSRSADPWNIFSMGTEDVVYKLNGTSIKIEVIPLPEKGKPSGFSGAVGQFSMKAQMNKNKVKTNDAVNLNVNITGKGNINLIDIPKFQIPPDIESYDPKTAENITVKAGGVEGTKSAEYVLIPRHHGSYKVEALGFSYFDPVKEAYFTLRSPEFDLEVEKGEDESTSSAGGLTPGGNRNEIAIIGNDIHYIKNNPVDLYQKGAHFYGSTGFLLGFLAPGLGFLLFLLFWKKQKQDQSDLRLVKSKKATRMAQKRLMLAFSHMKAENKEKFYEEVSRALYGYLSDRLFMQVADLSKDFIEATLERFGVSASTRQELSAIIDSCEFARYAPASASGNLQQIYDQSILLITKLENEITKAGKLS